MRKPALRIALFACILLLALYVVSQPFRSEDYRTEETFEELYRSEPDAYDVIVIGGSNAYTYWQAPLAWRDWGITSLNMGLPGLSTATIRYTIEETRKTQPDALYVITVNSLKWPKQENLYHGIVDYMRPSLTKLKAISRLSEISNNPPATLLKLLLPVFELHADWNLLSSNAYDMQYERLKSATTTKGWLKNAVDYSTSTAFTSERSELEGEFEQSFVDLLSYLEEEQVRVLFVRIPQAIETEERVAELNTTCDLVQERGFDYLDMEAAVEEMGFDYATDFRDRLHANARGSVKFTYSLGRRLREDYGIADRRGDEGTEEWEDISQRYDNYLLTELLPFELAHALRDTSLALTSLSVDAGDDASSAQIRWSAPDEADQVVVYRRRRQPAGITNIALYENLGFHVWEEIGRVPAADGSYLDASREGWKKYEYRAVPVRTDDEDDMVYGSYEWTGINCDI